MPQRAYFRTSCTSSQAPCIEEDSPDPLEVWADSTGALSVHLWPPRGIRRQVDDQRHVIIKRRSIEAILTEPRDDEPIP